MASCCLCKVERVQTVSIWGKQASRAAGDGLARVGSSTRLCLYFDFDDLSRPLFFGCGLVYFFFFAGEQMYESLQYSSVRGLR